MSVYTGTTLLRIAGTFTNSGGTAADAGSVTLFVAPPGLPGTAHTLTSGSVVKSGTGIYYVDLLVTTGGYYTYRWQGSGTVTTAEAGRLFVRYDEVG